MAPAPSRRFDPYAVTGTPRAPRPHVIPGGGSRIRWDRIGRMAILVVLVGMALLYVRPLAGLGSARGEAGARRAEVQQLRQENMDLRTRRDAIKHGSALEAEARRLGLIRPGERPFVVEGLPKDP